MIKKGFWILCFSVFILTVNAQDYPTRIQDCDSFMSCTPNNNYTTNDGVGGAEVYVEFKRCSIPTGSAGYNQVCLNNRPGASCPKSGCTFSCALNPDGVGWSFEDCNQDLHIGTIECRGCSNEGGGGDPGGGGDDPGCTTYCESFCYEVCDREGDGYCMQSHYECIGPYCDCY